MSRIVVRILDPGEFYHCMPAYLMYMTDITWSLLLIHIALDIKEYEECIDRCSRVLKEIDKYSESEISRKMEFVSDVHSYMGNAYAEMEEFEEAIEHHLKDYEVSKNT